MAFEYPEQRDSNGNIIHIGTWSQTDPPRVMLPKLIEDIRALKDDSVALPSTHSHILNVKVATTTNITLRGIQTVDEIIVNVGDLVLVKNQTDKKQNGTYLVCETDWTRTATLPLIVNIFNGTVNSGQVYFLITPDPIEGTSEITYYYMFGWILGSGGFALVDNQIQLSDTGVPAGTYRSVTVDSKGRVTAGTNPLTVAQSGITDAETITGSQAKATLAETNAKTYADTKKTESESYTDGAITTLLNSAPDALDTLYELANALGNDPNFSATITNEIGTKLNKDGSEQMTGALKLVNTDPTDDLHATSKKYVDKKSMIMAIVFGG